MVQVAKIKAAKDFVKKPLSGTRGEAVGLSLATGVAVGTTNNLVSAHYGTRAKSVYRTRRMSGKHGLARKGGVH